MSLSTLKRGSETHIRGFILNKFYTFKAWVKPGGSPNRHHSITNIKKGYPKHFRGKFEKIISKLVKEDLVFLFPHAGDKELHACAILTKESINKGLEIANEYRACEGLPPLNRELKEVLIDFSEK